MSVMEEMHTELGQERLYEIVEKIEMKWEESLFGMIIILNELNPEERVAFLNVVSKYYGRKIKFPQDANAIFDFSVKYLTSMGVDTSKKPGLQILNLNDGNEKGMYEMANQIVENHKHMRR